MSGSSSAGTRGQHIQRLSRKEVSRARRPGAATAQHNVLPKPRSRQRGSTAVAGSREAHGPPRNSRIFVFACTRGRTRRRASAGESEARSREYESSLRPTTGVRGLENAPTATRLRNRLCVPTASRDGDAARVSGDVACPHVEGTPLNEFTTTGLNMCFPKLFSYCSVTPPTLDADVPSL